MKTLVAKEIRLILPAYAAALLLAAAPIWLLAHSRGPIDYNPLYPLCLGALLLALSSFGREFGLKTFSLMLAQPLDRRRIWSAKIATLAFALATVVVVWGVSCLACLRVHWVGDPWPVELVFIGLMTSIAVVAGGLWTTLLLRHVAGAFWLSALIPAAIGMMLAGFGHNVLFYAVLMIYSLGGIALARWQFYHAQEVGWSGGTVAIPGWSASTASDTVRRLCRPWAALVQKEIRLNRASLVGVGAFFAFHLISDFLRAKVGENSPSGFQTVFEFVGGLWMFVPLMITASCVAEERGLGTLGTQLCLPVSRRRQYLLKLFYSWLVGGLLCAILCWLGEGVAVVAGARTGLGETGLFPELQFPFDQTAFLELLLCFSGLALAGFYGSTLASGMVAGLAAAVAAAVVIGLSFELAMELVPRSAGGLLLQVCLIPALTGGLLWSAAKNFRHTNPDGRFWWRNVFVYLGALVCALGLACSVHLRAWELVLPLEPAHGVAHFDRGHEPLPELAPTRPGAMAYLLPDGRLWRDVAYRDIGMRVLPFPRDENLYLGGRWNTSGLGFLPGSNWVNIALTDRDSVAIRADGTLWATKPTANSRNAGQVELLQFGSETNWLAVCGEGGRNLLLLKRDGTLWRWMLPAPVPGKMPPKPPALQDYPQVQAGNFSNWSRMMNIVSTGWILFWQTDGTAWVVNNFSGPGSNARAIQLFPDFRVERIPAFDHFNLKSLVASQGCLVGVRDDGTLWQWILSSAGFGWNFGESVQKPAQIQPGKKWRMVASNWNTLAGLSDDGTVWVWYLTYRFPAEQNGVPQPNVPEVLLGKAIRLGTHSDWVTLQTHYASNGEGFLTMASDGSLWIWADRNPNHPWSPDGWLMPSRKPEFIENIFAKAK